MNIPPKYEDVVAELEAALGREAALREELEIATRHLDRMIEAHDDAQQRLTVAEQLLRRAMEYGGMTPDWRESVDAALKPAEEGEGS